MTHIQEAELRRATLDAIPDEAKAEALFNAILALVDAKASDTVDRVNKTGEWSPDY